MFGKCFFEYWNAQKRHKHTIKVPRFDLISWKIIAKNINACEWRKRFSCDYVIASPSVCVSIPLIKFQRAFDHFFSSQTLTKAGWDLLSRSFHRQKNFVRGSLFSSFGKIELLIYFSTQTTRPRRQEREAKYNNNNQLKAARKQSN